MRYLVLIISVAGVLYLTTTQLSRSTSTTEPDKTLLNKPQEAREQLNKSLNKETEKARSNSTSGN